jgi:hypothetical protein
MLKAIRNLADETQAITTQLLRHEQRTELLAQKANSALKKNNEIVTFTGAP